MLDLDCLIRLRVSPRDAHYGGNLVSGAKVMELFGDAMTLLAVAECSDEGLLKSWENAKFIAPLFPGDFIRIAATKIEGGLLQEKYELFACREVASQNNNTADCVLVQSSQIVATAKGTFVMPYKKVKALQGAT